MFNCNNFNNEIILESINFKKIYWFSLYVVWLFCWFLNFSAYSLLLNISSQGDPGAKSPEIFDLVAIKISLFQ